MISIIMGVVQGFTEFLPISSSGHLVLMHKLAPLADLDNVMFDVVLHLGTLCALALFFWNDLAQLARGWWLHLRYGQASIAARVAWLLLIATVPAVIVGAVFSDFIEANFRTDLIVAAMLVIVGAFLIISEKMSAQSRELESITLSQAIIIGCAQVLAFIPGTSRSGITIIAGLFLQLKRSSAVRFSFLLAVPIIFGAMVKKIPAVMAATASGDGINLLIGFTAAFVSGFIAIKFFISFVEKRSLRIFAYYRFLLAALLVALWLME